MEAVIFDMDGVIIDSEPLHFAVDKWVLNSTGIRTSDDYLDKFVGYTNEAMWRDIKEEYFINKSIEELIDLQVSSKIKHLEEYDYEAIKGIKDLLKHLKLNHLKVGLASSSPGVFIEAVLRKLNIIDYFEVWISGEDVENSKPKTI